MARIQSADYDQRREAIVSQAARLFARTGFLGSSVADLAAACGMSKSLVYHYFPSKEDILNAVMISHLDQLVTSAEEATAGDALPRRKIERLIHAFMRDYVGAADRQKVLLNELESLPAEYRAGIMAKQRRLMDVLQGLLVDLEPRLRSSPSEARVETMLLFGMINWTHTWFDPKGPIDAAQVADLVLRKVPDGGGSGTAQAKAAPRQTRGVLAPGASAT